MADLTITAANVRSYGTVAHGSAGGTITAGLTLRLNTTGQLVSASDDSAGNSAVVGIALHAASANQPLSYHIGGLIDLGATIAIGKVYVASTSGAIAPVDDIAGGEFVTVVGVGITASRMLYVPIVGGVAAAGAVA